MSKSKNTPPSTPVPSPSLDISLILKRDYTNEVLDTEYGEVILKDFSTQGCTIAFESLAIFGDPTDGVVRLVKADTIDGWALEASNPGNITVRPKGSDRIENAPEPVAQAAITACIKAWRTYYIANPVNIVARDIQLQAHDADQREASIEIQMASCQEQITKLKQEREAIAQAQDNLRKFLSTQPTQSTQSTQPQ